MYDLHFFLLLLFYDKLVRWHGNKINLQWGLAKNNQEVLWLVLCDYDFAYLIYYIHNAAVNGYINPAHSHDKWSNMKWRFYLHLLLAQKQEYFIIKVLNDMTSDLWRWIHNMRAMCFVLPAQPKIKANKFEKRIILRGVTDMFVSCHVTIQPDEYTHFPASHVRCHAI